MSDVVVVCPKPQIAKIPPSQKLHEIENILILGGRTVLSCHNTAHFNEEKYFKIVLVTFQQIYVNVIILCFQN